MNSPTFSRKPGLWLAILVMSAFLALPSTTALAGASMESYISEVDGSSQPFGLYLPEPFDPNVPHPVVIELHGGGGSANTAFSVSEHSRGWIMVKPDGRGQHPIYAGLQENDVFRVLQEVRSRYPNAVDDNRIYIVGCSGGGHGSARLPFTCPDVFAAAAPVDGWYDNYYFHAFAWAPRDNVNEVHPSRAPLLEGLSPLYVAENAKRLNLYLGANTGDGDGMSEANKLRGRLDELGYAYSYDELPGGHCSGYDSRLPDIYRFFSGKVRDPNPEHVILKANQLKYGCAYWVRMERLEKKLDGSRFATIETEVTGKQKDIVEVTANGLVQFTLFLTPELVKVPEVSVVVNGESVYAGPTEKITVSASMDESGSIIGWSTEDTLPRGLRKTAQIEGPIGHAYRSKFLLVRGTTSKDDIPRNRAEAESFAADWNLRNHANISPVEDTSITDDDIATSNLILFGTADSNSIIVAINDSLPIRIWRNRIVAGANEYVGGNYGLYMIFPNPLNPERYVVISHGDIPGWVATDVRWLGILWPDYVVFDMNVVPRQAGEDPYGGQTAYHPDAWVEAGFFDQYWRLDMDEDGLDDIFEKDIIDADPDDAIASIEDVNPGDDFDGDGQDNRTEYNAGTNPAAADSFFSVLSVNPDPADATNFQVSWKVSPGRTYSVLWADSMEGPWHEVAQLDPADISEDGDMRTWTDKGADPSMAGRKPGDCPARFYRVGAVR